MKNRISGLASDTLIYGISGVVTRFIRIFLVPIYTRIFTPSDYGIISLVTTTMMVMGLFSVLCLDSGAGRWYWDTEDLKKRKTAISNWFWTQLAISLALCIIIIIFSKPIAIAITGNSENALYFIIVSLILPQEAGIRVVTLWFRYRRLPWKAVGFGITTTLVNISAAIILVVILGWKLKGVFIAQLISSVVMTSIAIIILGNWLHVKYFQRRTLRKMLNYSLPLVPASLGIWAINSFNRYLMQHYHSVDEVGLFSVAFSIASLMSIGIVAFQQSWGPFAMSIHKEQDAALTYARVLLLYTWIGSTVSVVIALFANDILAIIATEKYVPASSAVKYLTLAIVIYGMGSIAVIGQSLAKKTIYTGISVIFATIISLGTNFLLIPSMGKDGAGIANIVSWGAFTIMLFAFSQKCYPIPYPFTKVIGILTISILIMQLGTNWVIASPLLQSLKNLALISIMVCTIIPIGGISLHQIALFVRNNTSMFRKVGEFK